MNSMDLKHFILPERSGFVLEECEHIYIPEDEKALYELCVAQMHKGRFDISYDVPGMGLVNEAELVLCKNGLALNFREDYMRRRDGECMSLADSLPGDKPRFSERYGYDFALLEQETYRWLAGQRLILFPFMAGGDSFGYPACLICPENAAFFALSLGMMQGFTQKWKSMTNYEPRAILYLAPPFRHSHFCGKQAVVHRRGAVHEIFAYNLYPGPSAKKGIFSVLLDIGEQEGWVTNHASAAISIAPDGKTLVFMHEGASGGGKSEMLENLRRDDNGKAFLARNILRGEEFGLRIEESCSIQPAADDMVLSRTDFWQSDGRLAVVDGEEGWFLRVDGDKAYGSIALYESLSIHPPKALMFFNIEAVPGATCLIWEHVRNSDGSLCTNPRMIVPRTAMGCEKQRHPLPVDVRSFGVRMPPSTAKEPSYGVMGMLQFVPAALAWLWRLVSPRGYNNPSVNTAGKSGLESEGVGSYWPFLTGSRVRQANLLLQQLMECSSTLNILVPNQHIGAYETGFSPQWIDREFLTQNKEKIPEIRLVPARCPIFGFEPESMLLGAEEIPQWLLHPWLQSELGAEGYDVGARLMQDFFEGSLGQYLSSELEPLGRRIIESCLSGCSLETYLSMSPPLPMKFRF